MLNVITCGSRIASEAQQITIALLCCPSSLSASEANHKRDSWLSLLLLPRDPSPSSLSLTQARSGAAHTRRGVQCGQSQRTMSAKRPKSSKKGKKKGEFDDGQYATVFLETRLRPRAACLPSPLSPLPCGGFATVVILLTLLFPRCWWGLCVCVVKSERGRATEAKGMQSMSDCQYRVASSAPL